jgi:hypothetical protein
MLVAAVGLSAATARAQPEISGSATVGPGAKPPPSHPQVVLLSVTEDDPLAARLAAELEALGLDVSRGKIDPSVAIEDLVKRALTGGARGVVVADGRRTEFWVAEEGSDRIAMRQELEIENSPAMESVLSLRTVEFLRVSLGLASRPAAVTPPVVAPPVVPPAAQEDRRVGLALVSGVLVGSGRLPAFATIGASVRVRVVGPVGLEVRGIAPLMTQQISGVQGPVDTKVWLAGGGATFAPRIGPVGFELGAGAMAAVLRAAGTTSDLATPAAGYAVGLALYGRAAGTIRLSPTWSVRVDLLGGSTAPRRPVVGVKTQTEKLTLTSWGAGFVAALGGVEATF